MNLLIGKSQYQQTLFGTNPVTIRVLIAQILVDLAIHFNHERRRMAIEICD